MPFAARLRESLEIRGSQVRSEFTRGDSLEHVLDRHLLTVERMAGSEVITSILLLSADGKRLSHGAAPNLPASYRQAIDGSEIGPCAGSCGTAAYFGRPVYVSDIATDPLWREYRHLALPHGLQSCWSTPIRSSYGSILGTFAIYHRVPGSPTREEIEAIDMINEHVADAILLARRSTAAEPPTPVRDASHLRLVSDNEKPAEMNGLLQQVRRLDRLAAQLERNAQGASSADSISALQTAARDCRKLIGVILRKIEHHR
jgi:GAF domain-containing protein